MSEDKKKRVVACRCYIGCDKCKGYGFKEIGYDEDEDGEDEEDSSETSETQPSIISDQTCLLAMSIRETEDDLIAKMRAGL